MNKYAELMRDGAAYARMLAELQGDSNHLKDAEKMEAAAAEMEQQEPVAWGLISPHTQKTWLVSVDREDIEEDPAFDPKHDEIVALYRHPAPVAPKEQEPDGYLHDDGYYAFTNPGTETEWKLSHAGAVKIPFYFHAPVAPALPEPEGWKLVPVKPTDEMIEAVRGRARFPRARELVDSDYRDMLSVSPELDEHDADGAEMRRDAARYRWLKKYCNFGQDLDDAADAAMREEP